MDGEYASVRPGYVCVLCMVALLLSVGAVQGEQAEHAPGKESLPAVTGASSAAREPAPSSGRYLGHTWRVDADHLLWWDGKPYVRFGFTGLGDPAQLGKLGFDQFTLAPSEEWPISGPDPRIVQRVNEMSDRLEKAGATYYATLNALWPWRYGALIAETDKVAVFVRAARDVTEYSGRQVALDLEVHLPVPAAVRGAVKPVRTHAVLFDMEHGTRLDLSDRLETVAPVIAEAGPGVSREEEDERRGGQAFRVHLLPVDMPQSTSLRLVVALEVRSAELPGVNGLPPLWKPGIRAFYRRSLEAFRSAYAKPGLRGLQFGDEVNTFPQSLLTARTYLDLRDDVAALEAYRDWLARRFHSIEQLNRAFGTRHVSFDQVQWRVPLHPFAPELARTDEAAEREESWAGARTTWDFADTVEQVRTVSRVQAEFRVWFYGHWLAEYAKLARQVIGPVPVYVCSAGIEGDAQQYLALHRWALYEGVDGLIRNHYGHGGQEERETLASLARWMEGVQRESGCTKHLWANEIGYVRPLLKDDEGADREAALREAADSFGSQWAFPSQESLREMLVLLSQYGYRGFNRFLMNPSAPAATREVEWMAGLREEMVQRVTAGKGTIDNHH